jgi:enolase-phosphatase E1
MIRAILSDIEGTTSSISFVKDVLFPYAREHLADYVRAHVDDAEVRKLIDEVGRVCGALFDDEQAIAQLIRWIDEDRKVTPLKSLQGLIWEAGYRNGDFCGHVYADAVRKLHEWRERGKALYLFSSGSVYAQKLLFRHTEYGDLTPLFSGYFDTHVGAKQEADSYRKIAETVGLAPRDILFLSDIEAELDAAREAGLKTCHLVRDGSISDRGNHPQARDFDAIPFAV